PALLRTPSVPNSRAIDFAATNYTQLPTTHHYLIRTLTWAGSSRTTPTRAGATTLTGSWKSPAFNPSTSTVASNMPPSLVIASRGDDLHPPCRVARRHRYVADRPFYGRRRHNHGNARRLRRAQPERGVRDADVHRFRQWCRCAHNRHRLRDCLRELREDAHRTQHFDRRRLCSYRADDKPISRLALDRRHHGNNLAPRRLERHRHRGRVHLHDVHAEGSAHVVAAEMKEALARPRGTQIQHGDQLTRGDAVQCARRPAHPRVDHRRRVTNDFELRGKVGELEGDAQRPLDGLFARDRDPQQRGERDRDELQAEMMPETERHQASELRVSSTRRKRRRRWPSSVASRERSCSAEKFRSRSPDIASEMVPVSSETTIAIASFSSVSPSAARWRVPRSRLTRGFTDSGRKHAAAAMRSPWMITAPSCSGDAGWKMLESRS